MNRLPLSATGPTTIPWLAAIAAVSALSFHPGHAQAQAMGAPDPRRRVANVVPSLPRPGVPLPHVAFVRFRGDTVTATELGRRRLVMLLWSFNPGRERVEAAADSLAADLAPFDIGVAVVSVSPESVVIRLGLATKVRHAEILIARSPIPTFSDSITTAANPGMGPALLVPAAVLLDRDLVVRYADFFTSRDALLPEVRRQWLRTH